MIFVEFEAIAYKDGYKVRPKQTMVCPNCKDGLAMWRYGFRKRKVRDFRGGSYRIGLQRYRCKNCGKIFVILPSFLIPYKQYDRYTITSIQNGFVSGCGASYLSIYHWKRIVL